MRQKKQQRVGETGDGAEQPRLTAAREMIAGSVITEAGQKTRAPLGKKKISSRVEFSRAGQLREEKIAAPERAPAGFPAALHLAPQIRLHIVVAAQMQDAVDDIPDDFRLPTRAKLFCLKNRLIHADEQFAVQGGARHSVRAVGGHSVALTIAVRVIKR